MSGAHNEGFRLRICAGPDAGKEIIASGSGPHRVAIGRKVEPGTGLLCSDSHVSRHHATIEASDAGYVVTDHGSTNRTRLNGNLLKPEVPNLLHDGDELLFGPQTMLRFELLRPAVEEVATPTPRYEFGTYGIYDSLSKGTVDRVDVAVDLNSGRRVALKRFAAGQFSRSARRRLVERAQEARCWQHPNIAEIIDAGSVGEITYIASRLVEGLSLAAIAERHASDVEQTFATYVIREAAAALAYATAKEPDFVHRNLHPGTILVTYTGGVVLINFGLPPVAALREGTLRMARARIRYLAPEHRAQRSLDPRADIYSLGLILYELLSGEAVDLRLDPVLPDLRARCPDVLAQAATTTMHAIARDVNERIHRAQDFEQDLDLALRRMAKDYGPPEVARWMIRTRLGLWR